MAAILAELVEFAAARLGGAGRLGAETRIEKNGEMICKGGEEIRRGRPFGQGWGSNVGKLWRGAGRVTRTTAGQESGGTWGAAIAAWGCFFKISSQ
jgi:hypothetical protein